MRVPFLDLRAINSELKSEIVEAASRVLSSGTYILGDEVEFFEAEWSSYCESNYAIGVGNGLDALELALRAVGLGPGDEVIVPSHTFIATWLAVTRCGAVPVPVEPGPESYNLDPSGVAAAITKRTRAIVVVHLYGLAADIEAVSELADKHGIRVVEDAAQAHGAAANGRRIGAHSDAVSWSFYPGKNLGALGDAGAVTTDSKSIAAQVRLLRNYGSENKNVHRVLGVNSRLDPIQAAILRVKLRSLDKQNFRRQEIAQKYLDGLGEHPDLILPKVQGNNTPVWHLFVIRTKRRAEIATRLDELGIGTGIHYPIPPHQQKAFANFLPLHLPIAEAYSREVLSLPMGPHLEDEQLDYVIDALNQI